LSSSPSRVLIAVSTPWASHKLSDSVIDLLHRLDADAVVAHVAQGREEDEHESEATRRGEQTLKILAEALEARGIETEPIMLFGHDIAQALLNTARNRSCNLIVMGAHPRGRFARMFGRDIPTNLVGQADIPVLLCPTEWNGSV